MDAENLAYSKELDGETHSSKSAKEPIAICGLAMRLPGGINDAARFWEVLINGEDMRGPIPESRYCAAGFSNAMGTKGAIKSQHGYFLEEDLGNLDTSFFTMAQQELEKTDPQQRQILEVTRECLENAGETNYRGKLVGCYVGTFGDDWLYSMSKENQHTGGYNLSGDLMIANRVSFAYDFKGPSVVIKTGCSASLVGLHEACRALQAGDCDAAIVAGTSLIMGPTTTAAMANEGIISPEGSCKTFDAAADGFARAEAINAVYVKRLDDAVRSRNPIRAVIRNTGTNCDGQSVGLMAPNGVAHELLMRKVYVDVGLDPNETAFMECHGTGTTTGDPIETTAVGNVFGKNGVYIGSVKPNVGHSEGASGLTSLIKAILALEHRIIPPNIKYANPNPKIPFQEKKLKVPVKPTAWPKERKDRISVNSFGIGGSNAHVIVDSGSEYREHESKHPSIDGASKLAKLLVYSANTQGSLKRLVENCQDYLDKHPERLRDLCYTLAQRREHLTYRAFSVVEDGIKASVSSFEKVPGNAPPIVMVFSGQGAQWPEMGKELIQTDVEFRKDILEMDDVLRKLKNAPDWTIEAELQKSGEASKIDKAEIAQPLCTAIQVAIFKALDRCGIHPEVVVGHSSGEIAAAYATGALSLSDAIIIAYYRGYVTKGQESRGSMAAIGLDAANVSRYLIDGVVVACENSPRSTTISGDLEKLEQVMQNIRGGNPDVLVRRLKVDMAYHSHHMKPLLGEYSNLIRNEIPEKAFSPEKMEIALFSTVTEREINNRALLGPEYWGANLTSPVRFHGAISRVLDQRPDSLFVEIGPHSTLAGPLRQICVEGRKPCKYIPTMVRSEQSVDTFLSALGRLYQHGASLAFEELIPTGKVLVDLPLYPWDHSTPYWHENRISRDWRFRPIGHHAILGQRIPESTSLEPSWRVVLDLEDEPWLCDHKVRDDVVFPFAGYVAMAGEAIRQMTGIESGYSLRHVLVHTALVLTESKPVEMLTTLRRHKLTDGLDSDFHDFVISSYTGSTWIKNCEGRVKAGETNISSPVITKQARKVPVSRWYETMARVGLVYGPEFQGITELSTSAKDQIAVAEIASTVIRQGAPFLFHPAAIDACFHVVLAANAKGLSRNLTQLFVPTMVEEMDICGSAMNMQARAWNTDDGKDIGIDCIANGKTALRLRGARFTPLEDERSTAVTDRHAAARLEWYPDFDFMEIGPLFIPPLTKAEDIASLEELVLLCIVESAEKLKDCHTQHTHFLKLRKWLHREIKRAESGVYSIVKDPQSYPKLPVPLRREMIIEKATKIPKDASAAPIATALLRICKNAKDLFTGKLDTLELLMQDNILTKIYDVASFGFAKFIRALSITKPNLRILEVGAGTGGTTELLLRDIVNPGGNPAYSTYTFTDISAGFFRQAEERFSYAPNMNYQVFDISKNPLEQGFEAESYDVILAANVVHATPSLNATLCNLRPLLRPHGHLVLSEICAEVRLPGYIFGNFSGWWAGEADDRLWEPYVSVERWDHELKAAGFTGADTAVLDNERPYQYCAAIVTQPVTNREVDSRRTVVVLCDKPKEGISKLLIDELRRSGFEVIASKLGERLPQDKNVITTLDLEGRFFENITSDRLLKFQDLLRSYGQQKLLWLMPPTQVHCNDPRSAQTVGTLRVARAELAIPFFSLEIEPSETAFCDLVMKVFDKVCSREDIEKVAPDKEFVVDEGIIKIGRYQPFSLQTELNTKRLLDRPRKKELGITKPGLLDTLHWEEGVEPKYLQSDDQVQIDTKAVGLNFRDIMYSMGVLSMGSKPVPLGLELAGVVQRIGANVSHVKPGDRIFGLATEGCFSTSAIMRSSLVSKIPDGLSFEDAATMPLCYSTAIQALINVGQTEAGQTILIHSACGGVGLAAIQVGQMIGAKIYATVGTDDKVEHLVRTFGIPRNHIFYSRDESFLPAVMRETNGRGVDIVLNSLSGDLLHASWRCVAEFGKLVELGKRDLTQFGKLDLEPFLANRSYCCVDLVHLMIERPKVLGRIIEKLIQMYEQGLISPIHPMTLFTAAEIEQSFRYLQKGDHIGKAVVQMPQDASQISSIPRGNAVEFDPEACYLLTGGLGGLGRSTASWMVEHGARQLIFISRSAGSSQKDQDFFAELESMGCSVCPITGDVRNEADLTQVVAKASRPIRGVLHFAMVLRDGPILDLTHEEWASTIGPKVDGAWNLHSALASEPLDFFVSASSLVSMIDLTGQSNYAAANTFLESFCQYRHKLGLPASVLGICAVDGVGFVAENPGFRKRLKSQGVYFLPEDKFIDYVELAILNSRPPVNEGVWTQPRAPWKNPGHIVMGLRSEVHLDDPSCQTSWRRDRRMGMYHNIQDKPAEEGSPDRSSALRNFLLQAADEPDLLKQLSSTEYLAREIQQRIFKFMMKDGEVPTSTKLNEIGMDSLMAVELRRWWKQAFHLDISVLEIMSSGTLADLGKMAAEGVRGRLVG